MAAARDGPMATLSERNLHGEALDTALRGDSNPYVRIMIPKVYGSVDRFYV